MGPSLSLVIAIILLILVIDRAKYIIFFERIYASVGDMLFLSTNQTVHQVLARREATLGSYVLETIMGVEAFCTVLGATVSQKASSAPILYNCVNPTDPTPERLCPLLLCLFRQCLPKGLSISTDYIPLNSLRINSSSAVQLWNPPRPSTSPSKGCHYVEFLGYLTVDGDEST